MRTDPRKDTSKRKPGTVDGDDPKRDDDVPRPVDTGEELGEGNRTAAKQYNAAVQRTVADKDVEALADDAKKALDGPEGEELTEAEAKGKRGPSSLH